MKAMKRLLISALVGTIALGCQLNAAYAQSAFSVYGHISLLSAPVATQSKTQSGSLTLLTVRLYYPKSSGKPTLATYPDAKGNFRLANLPKGSYLLEIYYSNQLLHQRQLVVESDQLLAIPLGGGKMVGSVKVVESQTALLTGQEFQNRVAIAVGKIDLRPNGAPLPVTIGPASGNALSRSTKPYLSVSLPPSGLITTFKYNNQSYTLAGAIKKSQNQIYFEGEIYR
jgi:hypothetical protein